MRSNLRSEVKCRVCAAINGDDVEFSVTDTGIGISESDQRIIFEEFAQVDSTLQRRVKGTGLGLPLSRKFAELLGGTAEVSSTVGMGSTFRLRIPKVYPDAVLRESRLRFLNSIPGKKWILIVEDNPETAFIYSRYLSVAPGFQTYAVSTIDEAKTCARTDAHRQP